MPVELTFEAYGDGPPLIILHGLMGQARNWATAATVFGADYRTLAADLRNHGGSPWSQGMTYEAMADDVAALVERTGPPACIIGHSMGGKVAMVLALKYPELVEKLVVVDISAIRHTFSPFFGYFEAMLNLDLSAITRRSQADKLLADAITDHAERAFLLLNLSSSADTGLSWKPNLQELYDSLPDILDWPEHLFDFQYHGPVMFVAGGNSPYIQETHKPDIKRLFPAVQHSVVEEAGHWVHAEKPKEFHATVSAFLQS